MANPIATGNITRSSGALTHRQQRGLTLIECVIAMFVLITATLGILTTTVAGHGHLEHADQRLLAIRLAEQLIEEIVARPYTGGGAGRAVHADAVAAELLRLQQRAVGRAQGRVEGAAVGGVPRGGADGDAGGGVAAAGARHWRRGVQRRTAGH